MPPQELLKLDKKAGTLEVLLPLYIEGGQTTTHICQSLQMNRTTIVRALDILEELGLVNRSTQLTFPYARLVKLTSLGERVVLSPLPHWPSLLFEGQLD